MQMEISDPQSFESSDLEQLLETPAPRRRSVSVGLGLSLALVGVVAVSVVSVKHAKHAKLGLGDFVEFSGCKSLRSCLYGIQDP